LNLGIAYRGQPVLVLVLLLASWFALRVLLWQTPFPEALASAASDLVTPLAQGVREAPGPVPFVRAAADARGHPAARPTGWALAVQSGRELLPMPPFSTALSSFEAPAVSAPLLGDERAAFAETPAVPQLAGDTTRAPMSRWSGDAWLLLRRDTTTPITSGRGSYGRSQVGGVLRYSLAPSSGHKPAAYVRISSALADPHQPEAALGITGRPIPDIPVALAVEGRVARLDGGTEVRPAAFAYSEFAPVKLPLGARGEAYIQGGYVGGRFETPFVDGQVRIDRTIVRLGPAELRAGGGAWGGAQKGAKRLDIGPGATVAVDLGGAPLRLSADWRFRVAGEANPSSGPALTVSTGF
jgi:hypothetical protein